jgi:hypothetical protein
LAKDALAAKQALEVHRLDVLSYKGFYVAKDISDCEDASLPVSIGPECVFRPCLFGEEAFCTRESLL